jgi:hypothetical protein
MRQDAVTVDALAPRAEGVIRRSLERIAPGSAILERLEAGPGSASFRLKPRNELGAPITVTVEVGWRGEPSATVVVGKGSLFEVPSPGSRQPGAFETELEELLDAIFRGNFREILWVRRGNVRDTVGIVSVGREEWRTPTVVQVLPRWMLGYRKRLVEYAPYS